MNVHPSKTEVRFRHGSIVHDFVRDGIREMLMERRPVSSMPLPEFTWCEFAGAKGRGSSVFRVHGRDGSRIR